MECIEMIERFERLLPASDAPSTFFILFSDTFQRVLIQIIDQSFSNIYDELARDMAKPASAINNAPDRIR